nr:MAG TPA: hypothetical protein [Caudoviricetes sp.]
MFYIKLLILIKISIYIISIKLVNLSKRWIHCLEPTFELYSKHSCLFLRHDSSALVFNFVCNLGDSTVSKDIIIARLINSSTIVSFNAN